VDYDTLDVMGKVQKNAAEVVSSMDRAVATATWSNVAFYPIDPRGMVGAAGPDHIEAAAPPQDRSFGIDSQSLDRERRRSRDSLQALAAQTGGLAAIDANDFTTAFEHIVRANTHYYLLGYHPTDFQPDGAFRNIEVRVARPGVSVVARKGYVRPRADEASDASRAVVSPAERSPELRGLLETAWPRPGLALGVTAAVFRVSRDRATVAVTVEIPGPALPFRREGDRAANDVEVAWLVLDDEGRAQSGERMFAQPRLTAQTLERVQRSGLRFVRSLYLAPGRYQLRVAARESEGGRRGSVFYDLQVPDFGDDLSISGVLLTSRAAAHTLTPSMDELVKARLQTPPTVMRAFASSDVLTAYAEVYDALEPAHDVAVTTRVTDLDGREVFRVSDERPSSALRAAGEWRHTVAIPLARLRPGPYRLRIEATPTVGERRVAREVSFQVLAAHAGSADLPLPAGGTRPAGGLRTSPRIVRLEAWLAAVDRHEPGRLDEPALMVLAWTPADLLDLAADLSVIVGLIGDPGYPVYWRMDPARPGRPERAPYSAADERRLRYLAREAAARCSGDPHLQRDAYPKKNADRCANRLLKRGGVLHTDVAIQGGDGAFATGADDDPKRLGIRFADGRQLGRQEDAGQWALVRALLANVDPDPAQDETVRLWYVATSAYGQYHERYMRHEDAGAQMFPGDAEMQFFAGCLHEMFASPRMQSLARSVRLPGGVAHGIGSASSELGKAQELFHRALERDPEFVEARIRLGRVLHLRGRHEQAAGELQRAATALSARRSMSVDDGLLAYYAEMFLGAAHESLGRPDAARAAFTRAAALYPGAPSPRLALSRLALSRNDRSGSLAALREAVQPGAEDRDDPLWRYHVVQGRAADAWFTRLHRSLAVEP
jgi:tetratricopeptide (TPR) repeat protein